MIKVNFITIFTSLYRNRNIKICTYIMLSIKYVFLYFVYSRYCFKNKKKLNLYFFPLKLLLQLLLLKLP